MHHPNPEEIRATIAAMKRHNDKVPVPLTAIDLDNLLTALSVAEDALTFMETGEVSDYLRERLGDDGGTGLNAQLRKDWDALIRRLHAAYEAHPGPQATRAVRREFRS